MIKRMAMCAAIAAALVVTGCKDAPVPTNAAAQQALDDGQLRRAEARIGDLFVAGLADEATQRIKLDVMLALGDGYGAMAAIDALGTSALPEAERRIAKAHAYILQGNPQAAADLYDAMEPSDFSEQDFRMTLWTLRELGETEELGLGLEAALQAFPDSADLNTMAAQVLIGLGELQEAQDYVTRAIASDPAHYEARLAQGELAIAAGDLDAALGHYRAASRSSPDRALPHANIAGLQLDLKQIEAAGETLKSALAAYPEEPFLQWQLARYALATDDIETARRALENARRAFRGNDEFTLLSAQAEEKFGNRELALAEYRRYLRAVGEDAAIEAKVAALEADG